MDGGARSVNAGEQEVAAGMPEEEFGNTSISQNEGKDPRRIARQYQIDLCQKALKENTIAYLATGCGKTHIAILLMYEMHHLFKKPQRSICVFLAPTVALVEQQAKVIEESIDVKVGIYCGSTKRLKSHHDWEKEMEHSEVLVMTPQILLHNLSHCFIQIDQIALLIFDECHYAQAESYHPYAEIMKVFYKTTAIKLPRIFGMTASPKFGKGASINSLETLLHAKVYSVDDKKELEQFVTYPKINVYYYSTAINSTSCPLMIYHRKLEEIKRQCISMLSKSTDDYGNLRSTKKILQRLEGNLFFCLENLGVWGALQATRMLLSADQFERSELVELEGKVSDNYVCDIYLAEAANVFSSGIEKDGCKTKLTFLEVSEEPFFSRKVFQLINVLANFRLQDSMKCIVFVNRIITARSLSHILGNITVLSSWRCDFLVGVHSGLKCVSRKNTNNMLEKFRSGELNLLVATKVGEEGLDIQTCCLVIRFDLPETLASFIQSGGRARMPQSEYAFLVNRDNQRELNLIQSYIKDEDQMNKEIECGTSSVTFNDLEEKVYKVDSTGATISAGISISLLYCYCSKLPHDEYFNPKPEFSYFDVAEGTVCHIILPSNAAIRQISSSPQSSIETAKKDACLQACKELHQLGALTDYLLPAYEAEHEDSMQYFSDSYSSDDDESRRELHEMLVPAAFREPWNNLDSVRLNSYFIKFSPHPVDRYYKPFGLFVKLPLPGEAERMELDLQLARGRSVMTELVPSRVVKFDKDEIVLAEKFQKMFLKIIIDRSEFVPELVSLGNNDYDNMGTKKFYLMLPVIRHECEDAMTVDWKLIRRCLSSPIFRISEHVVGNGFHDWSNQLLYLANGPRCINDVVNSLVYVPSKNLFFFVSDVVWEKNAYSQYKESRTFLEHFAMSDTQLSHPTQPLLKAKQFFNLENLLRKKGHAESRQKEEHFIELPPEICELKIIGFSKDIGSSLSLLPSVMHRLESLLVAIELKDMLSASFSEGAEVTASRVLEALTTERCSEHFSLERLEVLGDAFLKFSVGRHLFLLHGALDEGQLTRKRSNAVNNYNLFKLATRKNLQIYIRDQSFEPLLFFALGRPCSVICSKEIEKNIHLSKQSSVKDLADAEVRCNKSHHWLFKKTIADVVEALVGAFIVDSGFKAATAFLNWIGIPVNFEASRVRDICSASTVYMSLGAQIDLTAVEKSVGYQFVNKGLLVQAFLHPSYNSHCGGCYQRLEFLGDAVLDYLMTSYVYSVYPKLNPGQLTDLRSMSVNNNSFAGIAINREFHKYIMCDSTDLRKSMDEYVKYFNISRTSSFDDDQVEAPRCPKALGDLVESCIGAILLDTGFDLNRVWKTMLSFLDPIMNFSRFQLSPIRELQELCQGHNLDLDFVSSNKGKYFSVEAKVDGNVSASSCAMDISRKAAKSTAAKQLILMLKKQGYKSKYKSLEDVVKLTRKMEAKLLGYDETPTEDIIPYAAEIDKFKASESSVSGGSSNVHLVSVEPKRIEASSVKPGRQAPTIHESLQIERNDTYSCHTDSPTAVNNLVGSKKTAKTRLLELCIAKCWKPPIFECCGETGPSHMKQFTFKVVLEIDEPEKCIVEITGRPLAKKKDAAANAAEGALWYLKHEGYLVQY